MKNFLAPVTNSKPVQLVSKFYISHKSAILTGSTITFSIATTAVTFRNASKIKDIIIDAKAFLEDPECDTKEKRNQVYAATLKELAPLVLPILLLQGMTIGSALFVKKENDKTSKELAASAAALSVAQEAITQYQAFQKDAEQALGEKKYEKLQNDIYKNKVFDGRRFTNLASEGAPGEILLIDKYSGRPFWAHPDKIKYAAEEITRRLSPEGGFDEITVNDYYDLIGNPDLTPTDLSEKHGYLANCNEEIVAKFSDSHYVFPNGTIMPAFGVYLFPEPDYIG